jgi:hypothetical protein
MPDANEVLVECAHPVSRRREVEQKVSRRRDDVAGQSQPPRRPPSKSFRPCMCKAGAMTRRNSSTRPRSSSDWVRAMLSCTPISPPDRPFSSVTNSESPPLMTVVFAQVGSAVVELTTNFSTPLMKPANGSLSPVGQYPAQSS